MSDPTPAPPRGRPAVVPVVLGFVVVAAVIAVGLLVVRLTDGDVELPDRLEGGYRATDVVDGRDDDSAEAERIAEQQAEMRTSSEERLEEVLEEDVTVRSYRTEGMESQVTITVIDAPAGPFAPGGPRPRPMLLGLERDSSELVREGDGAVCNVVWGQVVPEGEDPTDEEPVAVGCQLGAEGRTYWLDSRGVSLGDAVEILEAVSD
jgi:hypothetical protein